MEGVLECASQPPNMSYYGSKTHRPRSVAFNGRINFVHPTPWPAFPCFLWSHIRYVDKKSMMALYRVSGATVLPATEYVVFLGIPLGHAHVKSHQFKNIPTHHDQRVRRKYVLCPL